VSGWCGIKNSPRMFTPRSSAKRLQVPANCIVWGYELDIPHWTSVEANSSDAPTVTCASKGQTIARSPALGNRVAPTYSRTHFWTLNHVTQHRQRQQIS
jgi:hypothetical protein